MCLTKDPSFRNEDSKDTDQTELISYANLSLRVTHSVIACRGSDIKVYHPKMFKARLVTCKGRVYTFAGC